MEPIVRLTRCLVALCLFITVAGCSVLTTHSSSQDGPPSYRVDASKIPNAVPKVEALSPYGNPRSYVVNGRRYYVSHSAKNYDKVGYASWYGTKFHGRRTSSGEPYNMLAMTGASRTLPIPTYVQVTNLQNGRKVIVKINDRGPFVQESNRIIDLTYAAAMKLGFAERGTALVRVTAIDPYTWHKRKTYLAQGHRPSVSRSVSSSVAGSSKTYLQVAAYNKLTHAKSLQLQLNHIVPPHLQTRIVSSKGPSSSHLYRVQIGPIANAKQADYLQRLLNQHRLPAAITVSS